MKKILFIEDEPSLQETMGEFLKKSGFSVVAVFDGISGLETARKEKPDLILLDLILPRRSGFEVLSDLKQDAATAATPVVVLTNLESAEDVDRALEAGAVAYLVKANYRLEDVLGKVKGILGE